MGRIQTNPFPTLFSFPILAIAYGNIAFIGLENYIELFKEKLFWKSLWKTILWVVFGVGCQFLFGFILALLLNK